MLKKRIIPCLDVQNGRIVKGINFEELKDAGDPVEQAKIYNRDGADELCFLDISASNEKRKPIIDVIKRTSKECTIPLTVGGGINNIRDIDELLNSGADKVSVNTAAVKDHKLIKEAAKKFGSQCIVVAVDAKETSKNKWEIFTHGGKNKTGLDAIEFSKIAEEQGAGEILLTSMDRDGTKKWIQHDILRSVTNKVNIPVIASGGVGSPEHLYEGINEGGASAVLAASIFHYGEYSIKQVKEYLNSKGILVRI